MLQFCWAKWSQNAQVMVNTKFIIQDIRFAMGVGHVSANMVTPAPPVRKLVSRGLSRFCCVSHMWMKHRHIWLKLRYAWYFQTRFLRRLEHFETPSIASTNMDLFYLFDPCRAIKNWPSWSGTGFYKSRGDETRNTSVDLGQTSTFSVIVITRWYTCIVSYKIIRHTYVSNFWIWPLYKLILCTPRLPV